MRITVNKNVALEPFIKYTVKNLVVGPYPFKECPKNLQLLAMLIFIYNIHVYRE